MLELLLIVLLFVSSPIAEYVVLAIIVIYGTWALYMKTHKPEVFLSIQEAEDRRRAAFFATIGLLSVELGNRISVWLDKMEANCAPSLPSINARAMPSNNLKPPAMLNDRIDV